MFNPEECQAVMAEAAPHVDLVRVQVSSCRAWRVHRKSQTAGLLVTHGLPALDAQVVRYGIGGSYTWHTDGPSRGGSHVVQLSDPADYDGGALEVLEPGGLRVGSTDRGSVTSFGADLSHRAAEITRGERWVLVAWEDRPSPVV